MEKMWLSQGFGRWNQWLHDGMIRDNGQKLKKRKGQAGFKEKLFYSLASQEQIRISGIRRDC